MNPQLGQYFTTNTILKNQLYEFILNKPSTILEPSIGRGDLIEYVMNKSPTTQLIIRYYNGTLSFDKSSPNGNEILISDYFNVHVGLVSGMDNVYKMMKLEI